MKFNIGDKVRFLNDVGSGKVIKYVDDQTVLILNEDDFEIPVLVEELILDRVFDYDNAHNSSNNLPEPELEEEDDEAKETDDIDVFIALVKEPKGNILYLINDSNYRCFANVGLQYGAYNISNAHQLGANTKIDLRKLTKSDLNDIDFISVQMIFYKSQAYRLKPVVSERIETNVFDANPTRDNDFFDEPALVIPVFSESENKQTTFPEISAQEIKEAMQTKEYENKRLNKKPNFKSSKPKEVREIDLHIHALLDKYNNMTPKEILDYQMDVFRKEMKKAIAEHVKNIVFIHGKGNGSLKSELRRELQHKYRKYQFQDASFQRYGFGATMVYLNR